MDNGNGLTMFFSMVLKSQRYFKYSNRIFKALVFCKQHKESNPNSYLPQYYGEVYCSKLC